ncbi:MAG: FG-GAP repeat protein, partial [Planctomycetes bacterium]|nr:FG-GAP repeat protein [Planctomycetota bacterium]
DGAEFDPFGTSVAISGATAIVGVPFDDDNGFIAGSAYLFDTTTGRQIAKLLPDDGAAFDNFGISVGISGATAIVGAYHTDDNGTWSGSAYLFTAASGRQIAKLLPNDGAEFDTFGISVAISGATAIVGAPWNNDNGDLSGSAYLFDAAGASSPGDLNCDGRLDGGDIDPFFLALGDPAAYLLQFPNCDVLNGDMNGDGRLDGGDIDPFFECLGGGQCP